jgi:hypothetical protein
MPSIVSLVQLGFGGLVTALAVLSYRLMEQEGKKKDRNPVIYEQIQRYAGYTVKLALIVILGGIVDAGKDIAKGWFADKAKREDRQTMTLSRQAQNCREALSGLTGAEGQGRTLDQLAQVQRLAHTSCFDVMRNIEDLEGRLP